MFTGIIEELGEIISIKPNDKGASFCIRASFILDDVKIGDSICVSGCCLTLTDYSEGLWSCDLVEETLQRTYFNQAKVGEKVNLERSLKWQGRLGGHLVQGHIDAVGQIKSKELLTDGSWKVAIQLEPPLLRYIIEKGSIAVDGVSLTVMQKGTDWFSFAMIPHTADVTTLGGKQAGELVNLEVDLIAKYVENLIAPTFK
ncbi:MAG: riboflavin synthase [Parachlamydia sp.]|jgi:riboflavin synthase|nr:riboflavin synthase [Parachlamydia sp.]